MAYRFTSLSLTWSANTKGIGLTAKALSIPLALITTAVHNVIFFTA